MESKEKKEKVSQTRRRKQVISYFKQDGVNNAPYAYKLWPDKEESNARSQFAKCLNGTLNDDGYPYNFTNSEINRLYSLISSTSLNEERKRKTKCVTESELKNMIKEVIKEIINEIYK